ncbi:hypothetical protein Ancab_002717 [Ancistrocladus abbreviatus]
MPDTERGERERERAAMATNEEGTSKESKEGSNLLGKPTFQQLENGRFRCAETGHEMPPNVMDSYANSKRCRLGLIDFVLSSNKPPLNMFKQDPLSSSKLICKLTGDTINKSEEHIWKHINGRRFLNKLEQMEAGNLTENEEAKKKSGKKEMEVSNVKENFMKKKDKKKKKMQEEKKIKETVSEMRKLSDNSDSEEPDFWEPPMGDRWDFDDGGDRWVSDSELGEENIEENGIDDANEEQRTVSTELSRKTKRMSIEIGPSSFASRKKKGKTKPSC